MCSSDLQEDELSALIRIVFVCLSAVALAGCDRDDMHNGARLKPYEASDFFADGSSARPQVEGTVARHQAVDPTIAGSGRVNGQLVDAFPFEITREALVRGQQRYVIYCTPCHAATGEGDGMIVRRGFTRPPSFHSQKLREAPVGHFVDVMTNGYGAMYSYADRVSVDDRWKIAAYIRALQLSQRANPNELPPEDQQKLAAALQPTTQPTNPQPPTGQH